jgi:hypothetical protein
MKTSIKDLKKGYEISKQEIKSIKGGGGCCNPNSPFGINFPRVCAMLPPCQLQ